MAHTPYPSKTSARNAGAAASRRYGHRGLPRRGTSGETSSTSTDSRRGTQVVDGFHSVALQPQILERDYCESPTSMVDPYDFLLYDPTIFSVPRAPWDATDTQDPVPGHWQPTDVPQRDSSLESWDKRDSWTSASVRDGALADMTAKTFSATSPPSADIIRHPSIGPSTMGSIRTTLGAPPHVGSFHSDWRGIWDAPVDDGRATTGEAPRTTPPVTPLTTDAGDLETFFDPFAGNTFGAMLPQSSSSICPPNNDSDFLYNPLDVQEGAQSIQGPLDANVVNSGMQLALASGASLYAPHGGPLGQCSEYSSSPRPAPPLPLGGPGTVFTILYQDAYVKGIKKRHHSSIGPISGALTTVMYEPCYPLSKAIVRDLREMADSAVRAFPTETLPQKPSFRFLFPGYPPYKRQVNVVRTKKNELIQPTKGGLAVLCAQEMDAFVRKYVKGSAPFPYILENMYLVAIEYVSSGSLQPIIAVL